MLVAVVGELESDASLGGNFGSGLGGGPSVHAFASPFQDGDEAGSRRHLRKHKGAFILAATRGQGSSHGGQNLE